MSSILESVKQYIGPSATYEVFEPQLKMDINTSFFKIFQLGLGDEPFVIKEGNEEWEDFYDGDDLEIVKSLVCMDTRVRFDPPTNSALLNSLNEQIKECECRLSYAVDPKIE